MGYKGLSLEKKNFECHNCGHTYSKKVPRYQIQDMCPNCKDYYATISKDKTLDNAPRRFRVAGKRRK